MKKAIFTVSLTALVYTILSIPKLSSNNIMRPYEEKLKEINEEMGTTLQFDYSGADVSYDEMVAFYTSMTLEEFEAYIYEAIRNDELYETYGEKIISANANIDK